MKTQVTNNLTAVRKGRGVSAADLAERVGVTRQTIYAIEAGAYVPNTEVALNLARELEAAVDELFSLSGSAEPPARPLAAVILSGTPVPEGQPVRVCRVGTRLVGVPVSAAPYYLPEADAITGRVPSKLTLLGKREAGQKRLIVAGCDPATGLLARMVETESGVEVVSAPASSRLALQWLSEGKVHIAGSHLEDAKTGEFNLPFIRRQYPGEDFCMVTFAQWEEGLVIAPGNPKKLRGVEDLARKTVRFMNREPGSGSRALLDKLLKAAGIDRARVRGYDRIAFGHLAAAWSVLSLNADACLATRSAARTFSLDFIPLRGERYDLVMRRETAQLPAVQAFLEVLQRAALRRKLEALAGYDTSATGKLVA